MMKHQPSQSITSLPPSPEAERRARMIKYSVMMGIRVACIFALLFAKGWWILVFAAGAVFLPYFAVVVANVATNKPSREVERPGGIVLVGRGDGEPWAESPGSTTHGDAGARAQGDDAMTDGAASETAADDDDHPEAGR